MEVVAQQPSMQHRARVYSAAGQHAGAWLGTFPMTCMTTVRARHFQLALALRLGCELPELGAVAGVAPVCGGCQGPHDTYGFHPGICRAGNRKGLWMLRHDALEAMVAYVVRRVGRQCIVVSRGAGNWFGSAPADVCGRRIWSCLGIWAWVGTSFSTQPSLIRRRVLHWGHSRLLRLALG